MNKQEIICKLAELLKRTRQNGTEDDAFYNIAYNDALIDVMDVIRAYESTHIEIGQPTADGEIDPLTRYPVPVQKLIKIMRAKFDVGINIIAEGDIANALLGKQTLMAVKIYKETSGRDLKSCKHEIDSVREEMAKHYELVQS